MNWSVLGQGFHKMSAKQKILRSQLPTKLLSFRGLLKNGPMKREYANCSIIIISTKEIQQEKCVCWMDGRTFE